MMKKASKMKNWMIKTSLKNR